MKGVCLQIVGGVRAANNLQLLIHLVPEPNPGIFKKALCVTHKGAVGPMHGSTRQVLEQAWDIRVLPHHAHIFPPTRTRPVSDTTWSKTSPYLCKPVLRFHWAHSRSKTSLRLYVGTEESVEKVGSVSAPNR